ncbi:MULTISPECIES: DUF1361 domain-containing protein [unclassified Leptospira]|uniref:DUF1361 domain-containing protein n=1 Tax=unclassified Leptospira TaxID=2633828 RepID=UPI0002BF770B|nr:MULTISPECIES: DUF1361 domain-containing protein [unclassified Leptospira]EMK01678.1 PF07099 family protein [Leptospira sp. B5-022]MCR1793472.1 DUF1361 domain-containing protein [Leptospira sp. id769339]
MKLIFNIPFIRQLFVLSLSSFVSVFLICTRISVSKEKAFSFLIWNLFLAIVPLVFSYFAYVYYELRNRRMDLFVLSLLIVWFIFFPNAPYIVTDFVHLRARNSVPIWFDILMIFSFTWCGLFAGFISLRIVQLLLNDRINSWFGWIFIVCISPLTVFGICIGRFYRWNSWDLLKDPVSLFSDSWDFLRIVYGNWKLSLALGFLSIGMLLAYLLALSLGDMNIRSVPSGLKVKSR